MDKLARILKRGLGARFSPALDQCAIQAASASKPGWWPKGAARLRVPSNDRLDTDGPVKTRPLIIQSAD